MDEVDDTSQKANGKRQTANGKRQGISTIAVPFTKGAKEMLPTASHAAAVQNSRLAP
jgi:hypothetical protein